MTTKKKITKKQRKASEPVVDDPLVDDLSVGRDDLPGGGDVVLGRGPEGHAVILPTALRGLPPAQDAAVEELQLWARTISDAHAQLREAVLDARSEGLSWDSIGWCLGVTGRAAHKRWSGSL